MPQAKKRPKENLNVMVPDLYFGTNYKNKKLPANCITIEDLIRLAKTQEMEIDSKEILRNTFIIASLLLYGVQVRLNAKLTVDKSIKNTSVEKTFQQTNSHYIITRMISNSSAGIRLLALMGLQYAINVDAFGNIDDERTPEGLNDALNQTFSELISIKGSGTSKVSIKNPETRPDAIRAKIASFRSKWCSLLTYGFDKLLSAGVSAKSVRPTDFINYMVRTCNNLVEDGTITSEEVTSIADLKNAIEEIKTELNIPSEIDDSNYGIVSNVPIEEELFNFQRYTNYPTSSKEPIPDFINELKSGNKRIKKTAK